MSAVEDIRIKLENYLSDLEEEIESLQSALAALDAQAEAAAAAEAEAAAAEAAQAPAPPPPIAARNRGARGTRGTRRPRDTRRNGADPAPKRKSSAELERLLAETGGSDAVELARQTGTDYAQVLARIQELERAAGAA